MSYNHWRNEAKVNSYFLNERSTEVNKHKETLDSVRKVLIRSMMYKEPVNAKSLLDLIDGV
jgi:hypothetical protein